MPSGLPFSAAHISSIAARAAELEKLGEERQDPDYFVRAARLYTLAVRIADDIDEREALPFLHSDLTRVRDELRALATDAAAKGLLGDRGLEVRATIDSTGAVTRMFREIAARIEQRLATEEARRKFG